MRDVRLFVFWGLQERSVAGGGRWSPGSEIGGGTAADGRWMGAKEFKRSDLGM